MKMSSWFFFQKKLKYGVFLDIGFVLDNSWTTMMF